MLSGGGWGVFSQAVEVVGGVWWVGRIFSGGRSGVWWGGGWSVFYQEEEKCRIRGSNPSGPTLQNLN